MKPFATIALCLLLFSQAWAAEPAEHTNIPVVHHPTLAEVLTSFGDHTVPAAWSGIWDFTNSNYECTLQLFLGSDAETDTLCTGDEIQDNPSMSCGGTTTDTTVDITCTGQEQYGPDCVAQLTYTLQATRTGDTMTGTATLTTNFTPDLCYKNTPDFCIEIQTTGERVAPEPKDCTTSVDEFSWGQVKAFYR